MIFIYIDASYLPLLLSLLMLYIAIGVTIKLECTK